MGNQCSAPCLWKAWHLSGPGHPLAQWILIPYVWNRHYNVFQWICGYWNFDEQYSVRWSDLSLCMAWHLWGQEIHRHSEDQIHMRDTQIIVLIRVQMECWDLLKNNIQLGDQHQIWGWPDTYWAKTSTDTVKIIFTYKKQELKWISKYCVYCKLDKTNAGEVLSVCGWLGPLGPGHSQAQ